jgi:hypothetical protein
VLEHLPYKDKALSSNSSHTHTKDAFTNYNNQMQSSVSVIFLCSYAFPIQTMQTEFHAKNWITENRTEIRETKAVLPLPL